MARVLLVEDERESRAMLRLQLAALQIRDVTETADGEEALLLLDLGHEFDLILCDWHMQPMDGLQFCVLAARHLARFGRPAIPMVLLTGDDRARDIMDRQRALGPAQDLGIVDILSKPVTGSRLREALAQHLAPADE